MNLNNVRPPAGASLAYLVSQYPVLSMTFVLREVMQLRAMGFSIDVASINNQDRPDQALTRDELAESRRTHYVLAGGVAGAALGHLSALCKSPMGYVRGWKLLFQLARFDLNRLFKTGVYFTEALMVGRWMEKVGQRHLHVHLGTQAASVGLFVKTVFRFGYSITVHGPDDFYDVYGQYLTQKVAAADFIVCISQYARSQLMRLSPYEQWAKLHVARLGVDPSVFSPRSVQRTGNDPFEILCVGRLVAAKGQHMLIEAARILSGQRRHFTIRLIGGGADELALKRHVRELELDQAVIFEGPVNQERIRQFFERTDCFCLPSFAEGLPVALMEAMAMGIPCVTTHITGIPELIRSGETGLLVAPSDAEGLAANLALLMDDPALVQRLSSAARTRVTTDYDLQENVRKLGSIFEKFVQRS